MLVRDLMTADPVTVAPRTPVKAALALLSEHQITAMPVIGRRGRLRGVVSEADLIRDLVPTDARAHELPVSDTWHDRPHLVGEVMSLHVVTVHPETDLAEAVELITTTTIKSVPVVDHDRLLVGILSRSDVVRVLARADDDLAQEVDGVLASVGLGGWVAEVTDGSVVLTGPEDSSELTLAHLVAGTVPGVVEVSRP